jgi:hypothetical protein
MLGTIIFIKKLILKLFPNLIRTDFDSSSRLLSVD